MKTLIVRECFDCPYIDYEVDGEMKRAVAMCYAPRRDGQKPRAIGTIVEVLSKGCIPEWCPLEDGIEEENDERVTGG